MIMSKLSILQMGDWEHTVLDLFPDFDVKAEQQRHH